MSQDKETIHLEGGILSGTSKSREEYDKEAGECNLYKDVTEEFKSRGYENPEEWAHNRIDEKILSESSMSYQRLIVNRALRLEVGKYDYDTRDVRLLLLDEGSYDDWKNHMKVVVGYIANPTENPTKPKEE